MNMSEIVIAIATIAYRKVCAEMVRFDQYAPQYSVSVCPLGWG